MGKVIKGAAIGAGVAAWFYFALLTVWSVTLLATPVQVGEINQWLLFGTMAGMIVAGAVIGGVRWLNDHHS